ncbi:hypothetical protein [Mucilaginibacter pocheonensis]|uniref:Uncharacterized protein n=1 Tax=Mucilaginibacter pocheonensis TaxID=398050 RepID=A0ABU1TEH9_9SPHI|nr:hypothetical protein [Mucilaginibacter pocheonensis]MDR6943810.1 hypothetical protein [Mucilaginibacter pocheonensis]
MTVLKKIGVVLNLLVSSIACYAQDAPVLVVKDPIDIMKSMKLEYKKPSGFDELRRSECFKSYPKLERIITCAYSQLRSTNQQLIVVTTLYRPLTKDDSVFMSRISPNRIKSLDWMHEANIKGNIEESLGKDSAQYWRKFVKYYPQDKVKKTFNADSAITYSVNLDLRNYYQSKYRYLDVLCVAKKRRGVMYFFYLYTEEGKKHFPDYRASFEGAFRYLD